MCPDSATAVLVVDDDRMSQALIARYLSDAGYEVFRASDGRKAVQVVLSKGPRIVVTDWMMPEMDGVAFCRAIRAHEAIPYTHIILMTAKERDEDNIVEALDAGAADYLSKPVKSKELLARVRAGERLVRLQTDLDHRNHELYLINADADIANQRLADANAMLNRLATTDELTGLTNRRAAMEWLCEHWSSAARHGGSLACIMLDIDYFKSFNDLFGHSLGDRVLREVGQVLRGVTRKGEGCCRVGGEEFLVLCPQSTEEQAAMGAERIRQAVEAYVLQTEGQTHHITVSVGVAERTPAMHTPDDLLQATDSALYAAKDAGRNKVFLASTLQGDAAPRATVATEPENESIPRVHDGPDAGAPVILIASDDSRASGTARSVLEGAGYQVRVVRDGGEALARIAQEPPDVVIMDAALPGSSGIECVREFKRNPETRGIPVILASARSDTTNINVVLEAGADEHLFKPFSAKELVLRVRTMVRLRWELMRSNEVRGEQSRALALLLEFSHRIAGSESLDALLTSTLSTAAELTCCRCISILLPDDAGAHLTVAKEMGLDPETATSLRVPRSDDLIGRVYTSGQSLILNTPVEAHQYWDRNESPHPLSIPFICAPLNASERIVGVMILTDRQGWRPFTAIELEYIDLVGNIAASAIHDYLSRQARDDARDSIVIALAKLAEYRDTDTGRHLDRVTRFSTLLARELRSVSAYRDLITDRFLHNLERAVPLHDIGKVAVPDHILNKPGPLDATELAVMRTHATVGASTLRSVLARAPGSGFLNMAEEIAHSHHEWFDGRGYPRGLRGEEIPLTARIAAVADVYDALTTKRVYKDAMPHEKAAQIILRSAGTQFDPEVVRAFERCAPEFCRLAKELADQSVVKSNRDCVQYLSEERELADVHAS